MGVRQWLMSSWCKYLLEGRKVKDVKEDVYGGSASRNAEVRLDAEAFPAAKVWRHKPPFQKNKKYLIRLLCQKRSTPIKRKSN